MNAASTPYDLVRAVPELLESAFPAVPGCDGKLTGRAARQRADQRTVGGV
jgi:hypothetical protein